MTLRARTGRDNPALRDTTITFIRSKKRNSFLLVKGHEAPQELTFLQAEEIYRAKEEEQSVNLAKNHHTQVEKAVAFFNEQLELERQTTRTVIVTQSAAEKQALYYLDALVSLQPANEQEKELLILAKESINLGRFQKLPKDISAFCKKLRTVSMTPTKQLATVLNIIKAYPLQEHEEKQETIEPQTNENAVPEIIISESFN